MSTRGLVRLSFEVKGRPLGDVKIRLYDEICPKTCKNFRALCDGRLGIGEKTGAKLSYEGCPVHRVVRGFVIQSGDFSQDSTQSQGNPIHGEQRFVQLIVDMFRGSNTNGSQFFITLAPAPHLDGKHVAFGEVVTGMEVVEEIEKLPTDAKDCPTLPVTIASCGVLAPTKQEDKELDAHGKQLERRRTRRRRSKSSSSSGSKGSSSSSESSSEEEPVRRERRWQHEASDSVADVKPAMPNDAAEGKQPPQDLERPEEVTRDRTPSPLRPRHVPVDTKEGKKFRGRGARRFERFKYIEREREREVETGQSRHLRDDFGSDRLRRNGGNAQRDRREENYKDRRDRQYNRRRMSEEDEGSAADRPRRWASPRGSDAPRDQRRRDSPRRRERNSKREHDERRRGRRSEERSPRRHRSPRSRHEVEELPERHRRPSRSPAGRDESE